MKRIVITAAGLALVSGVGLAQPNEQTSDRAVSATQGSETMPRPAVGMGSKTMESCRSDTRKYCASATDYMHKECLVKNWDVISGDCQDALGKPFDGAAPARGGGNG